MCGSRRMISSHRRRIKSGKQQTVRTRQRMKITYRNPQGLLPLRDTNRGGAACTPLALVQPCYNISVTVLELWWFVLLPITGLLLGDSSPRRLFIYVPSSLFFAPFFPFASLVYAANTHSTRATTATVEICMHAVIPVSRSTQFAIVIYTCLETARTVVLVATGKQ